MEWSERSISLRAGKAPGAFLDNYPESRPVSGQLAFTPRSEEESLPRLFRRGAARDPFPCAAGMGMSGFYAAVYATCQYHMHLRHANTPVAIIGVSVLHASRGRLLAGPAVLSNDDRRNAGSKMETRRFSWARDHDAKLELLAGLRTSYTLVAEAFLGAKSSWFNLSIS